MEMQLVPGTQTPILRCAAPITHLDDALAIVTAAHEHEAAKILLDDAHLPPAFFDLPTRFAGELLQKLLNYRLLVAVVVDANAHSDRFREFAREARTGRQFRTFEDEASAVAWLDGAG